MILNRQPMCIRERSAYDQLLTDAQVVTSEPIEALDIGYRGMVFSGNLRERISRAYLMHYPRTGSDSRRADFTARIDQQFPGFIGSDRILMFDKRIELRNRKAKNLISRIARNDIATILRVER